MATSSREDLTARDFVSDMNVIALYALSNGAPFFAYKHLTFLVKYLNTWPEQADDILLSFASAPGNFPVKITAKLLAMQRIPAFLKIPIICELLMISILQGNYSGIFYGIPGLMSKSARSIPPLITVLVVVFLTGDAWRILGTGSGWRLFLLMTTFLLASFFFLVRKDYWTDLDVQRADRDKLLQSVACKSSVYRLIKQNGGSAKMVRPAGFGGQGIVLGTYLIYSFLSLLAVTISVSLSLVAVGIILISANDTKTLADSVTVLCVIHGSFVVTAQLLSISFSLGAFAAFFLVAGQRKEDRQEFIWNMLHKLRTVLIVYSVYCHSYDYAAQLIHVADSETGRDAQAGTPRHSRPASWAAVAIIVTGFVIGGIAMVPGPKWSLLWTGAGIVVAGGICALSSHIFKDWY